MMPTIDSQLDQLIANFKKSQSTPNGQDKIEYDPAWPSPCYSSTGKKGEWVKWAPALQNDNNTFSNVESALGFSLNEEFCRYFTRYYSDNLPCSSERGKCELLLPWNKDDFERMQQNLIGHLLMKQRLNQSPTLFFAVTDEEDVILSVDNATGEVVVERVGQNPDIVLAASLTLFLASLEPSL